MNRFKPSAKVVISFVTAITLVASSTAHDTQQLYSESICGRNNGYLTIRFPFRLVNIEPKSIGYPGFDLFCDTSNNTLLHIPNSGNFSVQEIDYRRQQIMLSDPEDCLAKRFLAGLDLSQTPFYLEEHYHNITFYNCSETDDRFNKSEDWYKEKISCLSTVPDFATLGVDSTTSYDLYFKPWCIIIAVNVTVPGYYSTKISRLRAQMLLAWDKPGCGLCEGNVTRCELKNDASTLETSCVDYDMPIAAGSGQRSKKLRYAIGISVGLGVPAILITILILYMVIRSRRRAEDDHSDRSPPAETD